MAEYNPINTGRAIGSALIEDALELGSEDGSLHISQADARLQLIVASVHILATFAYNQELNKQMSAEECLKGMFDDAKREVEYIREQLELDEISLGAKDNGKEKSDEKKS